MKLFTFLLFVIAVIFTLGCSTENPLCTDNYCVEGEIYPRSWLHQDEKFDEVSVDDTAVLNAIVGTTPAPPALTNTPTLSEIVAHVAAGGRDCLEQTYTIKGAVEFKFVSERSNFITLETGNEDVNFFISGGDDLDALADYDEGETYMFTVSVRAIGRYSDNRKQQSIHTDLVEE